MNMSSRHHVHDVCGSHHFCVGGWRSGLGLGRAERIVSCARFVHLRELPRADLVEAGTYPTQCVNLVRFGSLVVQLQGMLLVISGDLS